MAIGVQSRRAWAWTVVDTVCAQLCVVVAGGGVERDWIGHVSSRCESGGVFFRWITAGSRAVDVPGGRQLGDGPLGCVSMVSGSLWIVGFEMDDGTGHFVHTAAV